MIVLDTHVLLWLLLGSDRLGKRSRVLVDAATADDDVSVSAITFWEVATLASRKRIALNDKPAALRRHVLSLGIMEFPVMGEVAITAAELPGFHGDPFDQLIVATALLEDAKLVTADEEILAWRGSLSRIDARR